MKPFVKQDIDGFFGLFVDNLVQLILIVALCGGMCGMSGENSRFLYDLILPGAAVSILLGNIFYAIQAHWVSRKEGRDDVTALPYGINTPSLIVYVFAVMKPAYDQSGQDVDYAWRMGLLACLGSGIIEFLGAFVAHWVRKWTPRAALLSTLAGIAIGFISMTFALQIYHKPLVAMLPLAVILLGLFARVPFPLGLPSGFVAVVIGTATAWLMTLLVNYLPPLPAWATFGAQSTQAVLDSIPNIRFRIPVWCWNEIAATWNTLAAGGTDQLLSLLTVVVPMGLFNVVGSMQNIESAEAAGDKFGTMSSMAVNGLGTIAAALFGSCFPTTIYIGHPGWKALGARAGYSTLNGLVITGFCLFGLVGTIAAIVPIEAGASIVLWIGIIITAQAFQATPREHAPAVAIGLFPAIAAWGATVMMGTFGVAGGTSLQQVVTPPAPVVRSQDTPLPFPDLSNTSQPVDQSVEQQPAAPAMPAAGDSQSTDQAQSTATQAVTRMVGPDRSTVEVSGFLVHGLLLMERGYIFTCMILAAASACLIDRKFNAAGVWMLFAALFTWLGVMHAYQVFAGSALGFIFRFMQPVDGAFAYRADDVFVGYMLCALLFFLMTFWAEGRELETGHEPVVEAKPKKREMEPLGSRVEKLKSKN